MSTLKKIAEVVGCSISTVSRALNNCHDISEQKRNEILHVAKEIGYFRRKKQIKSSNRRKNEFNIAIICPEVESYYYSSMIVFLSKELKKYNGRVLIYNYSFEQYELQRLLDMCRDSSNIDAIICLGVVNTHNPFFDMPCISYSHEKMFCSTFYIDKTNGFMGSFEYAVKSNFKSICFVSEQNTRFKELVFNSVSKKFPKIKSYKFISTQRFEKAGCEAGEFLISRSALPSMIICAYDEIALGLIEYLNKNGINVPDDVCVVGMNDIPCAKHCYGGLSTFSYEFSDTFNVMARDLINNIKKGTNNIYNYRVESKFIKRNT